MRGREEVNGGLQGDTRKDRGRDEGRVSGNAAGRDTVTATRRVSGRDVRAVKEGLQEGFRK